MTFLKNQREEEKTRSGRNYCCRRARMNDAGQAPQRCSTCPLWNNAVSYIAMNRNVRGRVGWSLPLVWLLLAAVIVLALVAGWVVIPIFLGIVATIALSVAMYDHLSQWAGARASHAGLWFYGYRSLEEVADRLSVGLDMSASEVDRESALDWLTLQSRDGTLKLCVLRQHDWGEDDRSPCMVLLTGSVPSKTNDLHAIVGPRLSAVLATDVIHGRIRILKGTEIESVGQGRYLAAAPEKERPAQNE